MEEFISSEVLPKKSGINIFPKNTIIDNIYPELKSVIMHYFKVNGKHEKILEYEKNNNYDKYFITLTFMADRGCPVSQKRLMNDYMIQKNLSQNHHVTNSFYLNNHEYSYSASYIGWMYFKGIYYEKNDNVGSLYYKKAIELGNPIAMNNLVFQMLSNGDRESALELFEKSAAFGNPCALFHLGEIYRCGRFGEKNKKLAIKYYIGAIKRGNIRQSEILGYLIDLYAMKN